MTMKPLNSVFIPALLLASLTAAHASPVVLITAEEASLPPPYGTGAMTRGITRGPKIEVASTPTKASPMKLSVKFQSYGGTSIDLDSVRVMYLRASNIELTNRIKPFITPTGIDIPEAQLPPGNHVVRIDLQDSDGRASTANLTLRVDP